MKTQKSLSPKIVPPIERTAKISRNLASHSSGAMASTYCDIVTRECTPFSGDDAE